MWENGETKAFLGSNNDEKMKNSDLITNNSQNMSKTRYA